jgi:hypothetical protein
MNPPTREEFEELKGEVHKLREQQTGVAIQGLTIRLPA